MQSSQADWRNKNDTKDGKGQKKDGMFYSRDFVWNRLRAASGSPLTPFDARVNWHPEKQHLQKIFEKCNAIVIELREGRSKMKPPT